MALCTDLQQLSNKPPPVTKLPCLARDMHFDAKAQQVPSCRKLNSQNLPWYQYLCMKLQDMIILPPFESTEQSLAVC